MKNGGRIPWSATAICETFKISCLMGRHPNARRFGEPFRGPMIPFGSMVVYHPIPAKDLSRLHQFGQKVLPIILIGYVLYAGRIWNGDILVADIEELEKIDASDIHARRLNAEEVLTPMKGDKLIFPIADGTVKLSGGDQVLRTLPEEEENLLGESDGSSPPLQDSLLDDGEARNDFWSIFQETTFTVITSNRESNCAERGIIPNSTTIH